MKTFKQLLDEAVPKRMALAPRPEQLGTFENHKGIAVDIVHNLYRSNGGKILDQIGNRFNTRQKEVGGFMTRDGKVSYFDNSRASHAQAKPHSVAAEHDDAIPFTAVWNSQGEVSIKPHVALDKKTEDVIMNHPGIRNMWDGVKVVKD